MACLAALRERMETVEPFHAMPLEQTLRALGTERGIKAAALIHATRVAVTGRAASPGLFEVLELLGREKTCRSAGSGHGTSTHMTLGFLHHSAGRLTPYRSPCVARRG